MVNGAIRGRILRGGACLSLVGLVFFGVQTVKPLVNSESAAPAQAEWLGAQPAYAAAADGAKIYTTRCASCHQVNGQGVTGVFPPVAGSEWVTGDAGRLTRVILHGLSGPITVKGVKYSGAMPPWGTFLKDDEVAALATYLRSSWGNKAPAVTADQVKAVRAAHAARKTPWTEKDLADKANQGIPGAK